MLSRLAALLVLMVLSLAGPAAAQAVDTGRLRAELVRQTQWAAPGSTVHIALVQSIDEGWHTYWINPGDTGYPTELDWALPPGVTLGEIGWPTPRRILTVAGEDRFASYAYMGRVITPIAVEIPAWTPAGASLPIRLEATFYVCSATLCVPETARLILELPVRDGLPPLDRDWGARISEALSTAPAASGLQGRHSTVGGVVSLSFSGEELRGVDAAGAYFIPDRAGVIVQSAVQRVERGPSGLTLSVPAAQTLVPLTSPISGVLTTRRGAWRVTAVAGAADPQAYGLGPADPAPLQGVLGPSAETLGPWRALLFAVLGGLILNVMPCVFPILSMKAASLAGAATRPASARAEGFAFLVGVMIAFFALAGLLLAARASGEAAGWGFHLQNPMTVAALALIMLAAALNLSGLYHVGASAQRLGQEAQLSLEGPLARWSPWAGSALTGVLAVVVAAPCTAPFMAAALGYAMTLDAPAALLIFAALGLGFALPFVLISLSPALLRALPRPGPWLGRAKALLALPMYGAALWLGWVFLRQTDAASAVILAGAALAAGATLWLYGRRQAAEMQAWRVIPSAWTLVVLALATAGLAGWAGLRPASPAAPGAGPASEAWSTARVAALRADGPVLVNFTADWCLSCKVNEAGALSSARVTAALDRTGGAYLVADWTRRDAAIAAELARHGRSGVPLYLVYGPTGAPEILPQILSEGGVTAALERAARPAAPAGR